MPTPDKKNLIKIAVSIVLLVIAVVILVRSFSGAGKMSMDTHRTPYICVGCGHVDYYTAKQRAELAPPTPHQPRPEIICPQCNQAVMKGAVKCTNCDHVYPFVMIPSPQGLQLPPCPACGMTRAQAAAAEKEEQ